MDHGLNEKINKDVEQYRNALVYYARAREWETFEKKAGTLFDYLESIELSELERKFFAVFRIILVVLVLAVVALLKMNSMNGDLFPALAQFRKTFLLAAVAGACFELYFYLDFRMYVEAKMSWYKKRREQFIRNIKNDFRMVADTAAGTGQCASPQSPVSGSTRLSGYEGRRAA